MDRGTIFVVVVLLAILGFSLYSVFWKGAGSSPVEVVSDNSNFTVQLTNNMFAPAQLTILPGMVVQFVNREGRHTVTLDNYSIDKVLELGESVNIRFDLPGMYVVYCRFHGAPGEGMYMVVNVVEGANIPASMPQNMIVNTSSVSSQPMSMPSSSSGGSLY